MNIFELYKIEIKKIIIKYKDQLNLLNELNFNGVQVETPPDK